MKQMPEERYDQERLELKKPVWEDLLVWANKTSVQDSTRVRFGEGTALSARAVALTSALSKLLKAEDNRAECSIKNFVMERKN